MLQSPRGERRAHVIVVIARDPERESIVNVQRRARVLIDLAVDALVCEVLDFEQVAVTGRDRLRVVLRCHRLLDLAEGDIVGHLRLDRHGRPVGDTREQHLRVRAVRFVTQRLLDQISGHRRVCPRQALRRRERRLDARLDLLKSAERQPPQPPGDVTLSLALGVLVQRSQRLLRQPIFDEHLHLPEPSRREEVSAGCVCPCGSLRGAQVCRQVDWRVHLSVRLGAVLTNIELVNLLEFVELVNLLDLLELVDLLDGVELLDLLDDISRVVRGHALPPLIVAELGCREVSRDEPLILIIEVLVV